MTKKVIGIDWYYKNNKHKHHHEHKESPFVWCEYDEFDQNKLVPNTSITIFGVNFNEDAVVYEDFIYRVNREKRFFEDENGYSIKLDDLYYTSHYIPLFVRINNKKER